MFLVYAGYLKVFNNVNIMYHWHHWFCWLCPLLAALVLRAWGCCWLLSFIVMALNLLIVLGLTELAIIRS